MSTYIGKRVNYQCGQCGKSITLSKKTIDDSMDSGEVFCSNSCFDKFNHLHKTGDTVEVINTNKTGTVWMTNGRWLVVNLADGGRWKGETSQVRKC